MTTMKENALVPGNNKEQFSPIRSDSNAKDETTEENLEVDFDTTPSQEYKGKRYRTKKVTKNIVSKRFCQASQ